ncbi:MAG TPA: EAL domain-containing protein [Gammaproteobacteria bacterium]|nr:EAL domain-containing protein [Gammaproteobacteria bacterium]
MRAGHPTGLRAKLLLLIALATIPGMVALVSMAVSEFHTRREQLLDSAVHMANSIAYAEGQEIDDAGMATQRLAQSLAGHALGSETCTRLVAAFLRGSTGYLNAGFIDRNGKLACSGVPPPGPVNLGDRVYFRGALASGRLAVGDYQVGRVTGMPTLNLGYPVRGAAGSFAGVAYVAMSLNRLNLLARDPALSGRAFVGLADPHGRLLARYPNPDRYIGSTVPLHRIRKARAIDGNLSVVKLRDRHGREWLYAHVPVRVSGLHGTLVAVVGLPVAQVYGPIRRRLEWSAFGAAAACLALFVLAWLGAERLVIRPLEELSRVAGMLGGGSLDQRVGWRRADEIGALGRSFDRMAAGLARRQQQVERANRALRTLSAGNRTLAREVDERSLLRAMCEIPVTESGYLAACIGFLGEQDGVELAACSAAGADLATRLPALVLRPGQGPDATDVIRRAMRGGRPLLLRGEELEVVGTEWSAGLAAEGIVSALLLPLRVQRKVTGALMVFAARTDAFDAGDLELLEELAMDTGYGVTELRLRRRHLELRRDLRRLSASDPVTGLASRPRFLRRFGQWERRYGPTGGRLVVAILRLHRFDSINLAFGPATGDRVLRELGERLWQMQPRPLLVGRWGGAEIALMNELRPAGGPGEIAGAVHELADRSLHVGEIDIQLDSSIGLAVYPDHGTDIEILLARARAAADQAAAGMARYQVHRGKPEHEASQRLEILAALRAAIDDRQLQLHYQPKVDLGTGRVCGAEALLRWRHPEWGNVPPDQFIPLTEQTRLIQPVTAFGLHQARKDHVQLAAWGFKVPIAVNLSARVLHQEELLREVAGLLAGPRQETPWLQLELTETAVMEDPMRNQQLLEALTDLGVPIHLDDFGTGHSSLAYLQQLPVRAIKIDQSFIGDIDRNDRNAALVRATIEVAHTLELVVVAEGVESEEALHLLRELGCDLAQGYFIARPMPLADLREWLKRRDGRLAWLA